MNRINYEKIEQARGLYLKKSEPLIKILSEIQIFKVPKYMYDIESKTLTPINSESELELKIKNELEILHDECYKDFL